MLIHKCHIMISKSVNISFNHFLFFHYTLSIYKAVATVKQRSPIRFLFDSNATIQYDTTYTLRYIITL